MKRMRWGAVVMTALLMGVLCGAPNAQAQPADGVGKAVSDLYVGVLQKVVALMKDRPDPKDLTAKLTQLKEETIKQMVELGKKREALDPAGRKAVDDSIMKTMNSLSPDLFTEFQNGRNHYAQLDPALGKLIMDFHMIPQYAVFDNLKQHAPKEAERLGIK
jgi:hypothetical protein